MKKLTPPSIKPHGVKQFEITRLNLTKIENNLSRWSVAQVGSFELFTICLTLMRVVAVVVGDAKPEKFGYDFI